MNAIVVTFDRLPLSFLACYGNNWIETPHFDRFAAQSASFHQHFAESLTLDTARHAWWSGWYECRRKTAPPTHDLLPALLAQRGITVRLLLETETATQPDPSVTVLSQMFPECTEVIAGTDGLDVSPEETPFLRLVSRAQRDLRMLRTSRSEPWLLWIKSRGVPTPWLPPVEYATRFLDIDDEDDPADDDPTDDDSTGDEPDDAGEPIDESDEELADIESEEDAGTLLEMSPSQFDDLLRSSAKLPPGRALRDAMTDIERALTRKVLGGYVALLDAGFGRLLEAIDQAAAGTPTLVIVTAAQGLTVHDASLLRDVWESSSDEVAHVPLMIRSAGITPGVRRQSLTQPIDVFPTLLDWFGIDGPDTPIEGQSLLPAIRDEQFEPRQAAFATDGGQITTIRTSDHYFVQKSAEPGSEPTRRLFTKPEDVWDVNDLAAQSPQIVDELARECEQFFGEPHSAPDR